MRRGQFDDAAEQLRIAVKLRPQNGDAWAILGSIYKQQNKLVEASDAVQKAIVAMPDQPRPHSTLAGILAQQGRTEEAAAERKKAADLTRIAVNRQRANFEANTGSMLLQKNQITDAIERYQEAVSSVEVFFKNGLAEALPFTDAQFDVVMSTVMLHHLPRKARLQCANEIRRVLKPDGRVLAVDFEGFSEQKRSLLSHFHRPHGHVRSQDIVTLLNEAGLSVVESGPVGIRDLHFVLAKPGCCS